MQCSNKYTNQCISAIIAGLVVMCVGCSVGWTTPTLKNLRKPDSPIPLSKDQTSWLAAAHEVGHFLSPIPSGLLIGRFGRRHCFLASSLIQIVGWIIVYFANQVVELYVARFFFGISMGIVFTTVPLYLAEIASPRVRGALSTSFQAMLYLGHLIEFCIGPYVPFSTLNLISLLIACATFCTLFFIAESPLYLMVSQQRNKAFSVIRWLNKSNEEEAEREVSKLTTMVVQVNDSRWFGYNQLFSKGYLGKLCIVLFTAIAQRFTGMSAIVAYAATNFATPKSSTWTSDEYTILFGALVFLFTFVSASLIDNIGRRPLLLFSCFGCAVTHFITGTYFYEHFKNLTVLPFVMISLFSIIYSLGLGPLMNTLQGELFPPHLKGLASSFVTVSHAASSFAVTKLFGVIKEAEGVYLNFYIFAGSCIISFIVAYFIVPETKREELGDLQRLEERYT